MAIKINLMPNQTNERDKGYSQSPTYFFVICILMIVGLLVYSGVYLQNSSLEKKLENAEAKNVGVQGDISKSATAEELSAVVAAISKGKSARSILSSHLYNSKLFEMIEGITIKNIIYSSFSETVNKDGTISVVLEGDAESFGALAKQLTVYKKTKEVQEVVFSGASANKGGKVGFVVDLIFSSSVIISRPVITLSGSNIVEVKVGANYSDAGAFAIDGIDGVVAVTTTGLVDTGTVGTYTLVYNAINAAGNAATLTRTVNVVSLKAK